MEFGDMVRAVTEYFTVSQYQFKVSDKEMRAMPMNIMLLSQLLALNRCLPTALAKSRFVIFAKMFVLDIFLGPKYPTGKCHNNIRRIFLLKKIFHGNLNQAISTSEIILFKFLWKIVLKKKLTITFSAFKVYNVRSLVLSLEA